jgi:allene oxide cyclase
MSRTDKLIGVFAAVALITAALVLGSRFNAAPAAARQSEDAMGERLVVIEHANPTRFDVGEAGDSVGDTVVFANDLYDEANVNVVGTVQGVCVRTVVGKSMECFLTNIFQNGMITVQGPADDSVYGTAEISAAITGGTGDYLGASGELKIKKLEGNQFTHVFELT